MKNMRNIIFFAIGLKIFCLVQCRLDEDLVSENKTIQRIQATQVFKPMGSNFQYHSGSLYKTKLIQNERIDISKARLPDITTFRMVAHNYCMQIGPARSMFLRHLLLGLSEIQSGRTNGVPLKTLEKQTVIRLLRYLQTDDLEENLRFLYLSVLRMFLDYLPISYLNVLRTDINQGPLSRAALELSLTKDFKDIAPLTKAAKTDVHRETYPGWLEALHRVELLDYIRQDQMEASDLQPSDSIIKLHNGLMKEKFSLEKDALGMTKVCIEFLNEPKEIQNQKEWEYQSIILSHLVKFSPESRTYLKEKSSKSPLLEEIFQRIMRWKEIRPVIDYFFATNEVDPYIASLLLPFGKYKPVTLAHYEYLMKVIESQVQAEEEAYEAAQKEAHAKVEKEAHGEEHEEALNKVHPHDEAQEDPLRHYLPKSKEREKYKTQMNFTIKIFYDASVEIPDAKALLDSKLQWKDNKYHLKIKPIPTMELESPGKPGCVICLSDYKPGERVIQLKWCDKHIYHEDCLKPYMIHSRGHPSCPICREPIEKPIPIKQHVFWMEDSGSDTSGSA
ncbi:hypothetical protein DFH28DRAFT_1110593 [Melampsora americana]|nr:hypothetical protein DFH28DRAFT_1110593 [Melampsora americana]